VTTVEGDGDLHLEDVQKKVQVLRLAVFRYALKGEAE